MTVIADFEGFDRIAKARKKRLCVLADFFVKPDLAVQATNGELPINTRRNCVELGVFLVVFCLCELAGRRKPWIECEDRLL